MTDDKPYYIHKPKQDRSAARYHHILDTAAQVFVRHGYEALGTNHIAAEAGVSVGSVYRFFSGKDALMDALIERYLDRLSGVLPSDINPTRQTMPALVGGMLAGLFAFVGENAAFEQILNMPPNSALGRTAIHMHLLIEDWVAGMLTAYHPTLPSKATRLCAAGGMGIVKGMMTLTHPPDSIPFEVVLSEMVAALMAYVEDFVRRMG